MKIAVLQVADTGPLESLVIMLRSVGYECRLPDDSVKRALRSLGRGLVLDVSSLVKGMGYDWPIKLPEASLDDMGRSDILYVDVKAHQCYDKLVERWPNLSGRVLWYRIQGGRPEHVIRRNDRGDVTEDCGDEISPPCPVLTPNQWYGCPLIPTEGTTVSVGGSEIGKIHQLATPPWAGHAFACWPPFYRFDEYYDVHGRAAPFDAPVCLIHGISGWGYRDLIPNMRALGVKCYGAPSPDGLIPHSRIPALLSRALAMVHLKSSDAPGYALYEALAAACPVVCTRRLIWRCKMESLLIPGKTCLVFDRETHDGLTADDVAFCTHEVKCHLENLRSQHYNRQIGEAGRERLREVMWREDRAEDVEGLRTFLERHFS